MSTILHIDTAGADGLTGLSSEGRMFAIKRSADPRDHAAFVQPAIRDLLHESGISGADLAAVAVANGPGSYTGLRVGLASAKGLCIAWNLPLITLSSLQIQALGARLAMEAGGDTIAGTASFVAMTDARRMEVFWAAYDADCRNELQPATASVLTEELLSSLEAKGPVYITGNGAEKFAAVIAARHQLHHRPISDTASAFARLAREALQSAAFADLDSAEPFYAKAFYQAAKPAGS